MADRDVAQSWKKRDHFLPQHLGCPGRRAPMQAGTAAEDEPASIRRDLHIVRVAPVVMIGALMW
ncbi:hypothetical protein ABTD78_25915, partial [Acinetobacter baumannii]